MTELLIWLMLVVFGAAIFIWGCHALIVGEFRGRYRYTNTQYSYRRADRPRRYWAETLKILLGGIGCMGFGLWMIYHHSLLMEAWLFIAF